MESPKRIAFFVPYLFPGGGDLVLLSLAEGFVQKGYQVDFLLGREGGPLMEKIPRNITLHSLRAPRMFATLSHIRRYIQESKPTALIATQEHAHMIIILANLLAGRKTKTIIRIGTPFSMLFKKYDRMKDATFMPILSKILYRFADRFVAVSEGVADDFSKTVGVVRSRITVIHNPKDIETIQKLGRDKAGHPWADEKKVPLIVGSGRLSEVKDFTTLLRAFKELTKEIDARLLILGDDGGERKNLEEFIQENNLKDKVKLTGFVQNPYAYMAKADVFALTSKWEGLPNVLIEALALGVLVVSTDCPPGGAREILGSESDVIIPVSDPRALSEKIKELITNKDLAAAHRMKNKKRAENFAFAQIVRQYESLLVGV